MKAREKPIARLAEPSFPLKFSDRDILAIVSHVGHIEQRKLVRLGDVLNDWANRDLQRAFPIYPDRDVARGQLKAILCVMKHAEGLRGALENFERFDGSSWRVGRLIEGRSGEEYSRQKAVQSCRLTEQKVFLRELESV